MGIPKHIREKLGITEDENCHDIMLEETKKKWPEFEIEPEIHAKAKTANSRLGQIGLEGYGKAAAGLNSMNFPIKNNKEEMKNLLKPWLTALTIHTNEDFDKEWQIILNMASDDPKVQSHVHSIDTALLRQNKQLANKTHAFKDIEQMIRMFDLYDFIDLEVRAKKDFKELDTIVKFFHPLQMSQNLPKKFTIFEGAFEKNKQELADFKKEILKSIDEIKKGNQRA